MRSFAIGGGLPPVVKNLLIINGLFYLLKLSFGNDGMGRNELDGIMGMHYLGSPLFKPWQLLTHMFMHGDVGHLFVNMFALFMFGGPMEQRWGSKRFLTYYLLTGFGAVALHTGINAFEVMRDEEALAAYGVEASAVKVAAVQSATDIGAAEFTLQDVAQGSGAPMGTVLQLFYDYVGTMIGASGAVFGVLLAFGMYFPNTQLFLLFPPIPIKAKYFVIGYGLLELFAGITQSPGDNVAHFAHLGGMLFGIIIIRIWRRKDPFA
ncbi:MAG: rhomboid family intramembrane serine protease [Flavobacteriales bacterium]|nr:rhomboid family intramembrane serine protease [Flavobacteriales bacterium]